MSNLERMRAYAAAHPTDVVFIREAVRHEAEIEAYRELAHLARKWRNRQDALRRQLRAESHATVHAGLVRTLQGLQSPLFQAEPFPLVRRIATQRTVVRRNARC